MLFATGIAVGGIVVRFWLSAVAPVSAPAPARPTSARPPARDDVRPASVDKPDQAAVARLRERVLAHLSERQRLAVDEEARLRRELETVSGRLERAIAEAEAVRADPLGPGG